MTISIGDAYISGSAGTVQYSGLTSETNWVDLVDELMELERFHVNRLNSWKQEWSNKITALQGLDSRLLILESKAGDINTQTEFYSRTSASSDEEVVTVTNTASAVPGAHTVIVGSNVPHRLACQGWPDSNTTSIGDRGGDFIIGVGTQGTITIADANLDPSTTLENLRDLINNDAENTGEKAVTASILHDGSTANPYRLVITANNGGPEYEIAILGNPTNLNFHRNDISPADTGNLTATTTATISTLGSFTEDKTVLGSSGCRTYTFTGPASEQIVGSGNWTISWSGDNGGGSGAVDLGSEYTPGDTIEIEDGILIQFSNGIFEGGSRTFTVNAHSADIDDPVNGTWGGTSSVNSDGNYVGSTSKTFRFTISEGGTKTVGTDAFDVTWTDGEGNSGTINVTPTSYTDLTVSQGLKISFEEGTVQGGDTFSVDVFSPTIQAAAASGLAQVEVETHSGFVDEGTSYVTTTSGTFSYTYGGVTRTLSVPANSTLAGLRDLINSDTDNPGVTALIINDGSGLSTAYHLQLYGNDSGAAYSIEGISHTLDNFAKDGTTGFGFSEIQSAQNAMIKVDGYPQESSEYIQRESNSISDLITGVTLGLAGTGTATISVINDTAAIMEKIGDFVASINSVLDYIKSMTAYDEEGEGENNGIMIGNYAFQIVQQRLNDILSSQVPGLTGGMDTYTHLGQIGIASNPDEDGKWEIDQIALSTAVANDLQGVSRLFTMDETRETNGIAELIRAETDSLTEAYTEASPGIVSVLVHNYGEIIEGIDDKIEREERRLALVENRLNTRYSQLETLLGELQGQESFLTSMLDTLSNK